MNILDYLDDLTIIKRTGSYIEAKCPVCEGKLKISLSPTKYGAYACYTNNCEKTRKIREALYRPFNGFKVKQLYKRILPKTVKRFTLSKPLQNINLDLFRTNQEYIEPERYKDITIYKYKNLKVWRKDIAYKVKMFASFHLENGEWIEGLQGLDGFPIYKEEYLQPYIFMVEGEKCADWMHKHNYAAITVASSYNNEHGFELLADELISRGVKGVLYLQDNDEAGLTKSNLCSAALWSRQIECNVVNLAEFFSDNNQPVDGFDVADIGGHELEKVLEYAVYRSNRTVKIYAGS